MHQVVLGAQSEKVREKGIDPVMTPDQLNLYAINRETIEKQKKGVKRFPEPYEGNQRQVARIKREPFAKKAKLGPCGRCGAAEHDSSSQECKAKTGKCHNCNGRGHYARMCRNKP